MKTLYLTDLDGTLLRPDTSLSGYSKNILNRLIAEGMIFSFATARSYNTALPLLEGVTLTAPMIVHNGVFIVDESRAPVYFNGFRKEESEEIFGLYQSYGIFPIVYSRIEGHNRMSFLQKESSKAQTEFALSRMDDKFDPNRVREIFTRDTALDGDVFYFTAIDDENKLLNAYKALKEKHCCFYARDMYSGEWWLEVMPKSASKAVAAVQLKKMLGADRLICFGDAVNDIPMFEISDECYAVENAAEALKRIASGVIGANKEDGVAHFLAKRFHLE